MKAITLQEPRRLERVELDEPRQPADGEALVRVDRVGICGTDISGYLGKFPFFRYPRIPGHELGVEVVAVGARVEHVQPGDRCSVEPYMNCGRCFACRRGYGNCCENLEVLGVMIDGGLRERFIVRADKLHPSSELSFEQLALVETLAIGCHATRRGGPQQGDHLLIIGAGPIGLAVLEFSRLTGATVSVMDISRQRLDFCRDTYGIQNTVLNRLDGSELEQMRTLTGGDMYSVVIDATGNKASMSAAIHYVAHSGTLVYVGITTEELVLPHPAVHRREMTIRASRNAMPDDFRRIIELIEGGTIDTGPWITHRTTFDELPRRFEDYTRPETGVIKAVVGLT